MMRLQKFPAGALILATGTVIASASIAIQLHGTPWSTVSVLDLRKYGGITHDQILQGPWWRFITAQFVHSKQGHMVFNVLTLFPLGVAVEKVVGTLRFFLLWLISGVVGIYASVYFAVPPWDVGTGGSQAIMGISAAAMVAIQRGHRISKWLKGTLFVTVGMTLGIDCMVAHYPKPGHIAGFVAGYLLSLALVPQSREVHSLKEA